MIVVTATASGIAQVIQGKEGVSTGSSKEIKWETSPATADREGEVMDPKRCGVGQECGEKQRLVLRDEGTCWAGSRSHRPKIVPVRGSVLGDVWLNETWCGYPDLTSTCNLPDLFWNVIPATQAGSRRLSHQLAAHHTFPMLPTLGKVRNPCWTPL